MTLRDQLLTTAGAYCAATGMSRSRLSTIIFSGGRRLQQIDEGGDVSTSKFEESMQWFSENWPVEVAWPSDIPRPVNKMEAAE